MTTGSSLPGCLRSSETARTSAVPADCVRGGGRERPAAAEVRRQGFNPSEPSFDPRHDVSSSGDRLRRIRKAGWLHMSSIRIQARPW